MKYIFIFLFLFFLSSCSKSKVEVICGDHICINNDEAESYFKENLSIEVKVIRQNKKEKIDLVELNLKNTDNKEVIIKSKEKTNNEIKVLNNKEIAQIKSNLKKKKDENINILNSRNLKSNKRQKPKKSEKSKKSNKNEIDVCKIIEKCNIEEISKYLINSGKNKRFPDINTRITIKQFN